MAFLTTLGLAVALLVVAPYLAHRLRRLKAQDLPFPPAHLVVPSPEKARRRSRLEDRALLATRSLAVIGLAVLGATPFVRCSRLALQRSGGASVAIALVVDDSMSMRAMAGDESRFDRVRRGARELLASMREGDAVAVVLAGAPARVGLAPTTDLGAARDAIAALAPADRSTDLDGAVTLARGLIGSLPQLDRRVVVLSDLADGHPDGPPLAGSNDLPLWVALPELAHDGTDCAVMRADRQGVRVRVAVACGPGKSAAGREVTVEDADGNVLGHAVVDQSAGAEVTVLLPSTDAKPARARLRGTDAVAADDVAPVVPEASRGAIAVVADATTEAVATGGAPIVEQALSSLKLDTDVRPLPAMPDRVEDLDGALGIVLDDPAGLTPEQRHALAAFLDRRWGRAPGARTPRLCRSTGGDARAHPRASDRVERDDAAGGQRGERDRLARRIGPEPHPARRPRGARRLPRKTREPSRRWRSGSTDRFSSAAARWVVARRGS